MNNGNLVTYHYLENAAMMNIKNWRIAVVGSGSFYGRDGATSSTLQSFARLRHNRFNVLWLVPFCICLWLAGCQAKDDARTEKPVAGNKSQATDGPVFRDTGTKTKVSFVEVLKDVGIESTYLNGEEANQYAYVEFLGGGVASLDYDLDGRIDLFFPKGGKVEKGRSLSGIPSKFFRNLWPAAVDVSQQSFTAEIGFYSHGVTAADANSDGFPDLFVTGFQGVLLLINCGDGTYIDATDGAAFGPIDWASSSGWGDFDNDGYVDLYVSQYVDWSWDKNPQCRGGGNVERDLCTPQDFNGLQDLLFWNNGDGSFTRETEKAGLVKEGKGLGVIAFDANHDSRIDIYVANDTTNNFLYLNQGGRRFNEAGVISGTAFDNMGISNGSMGLAILDFNDDQKCDLFVTNYERETFAVYQNDGKANFRHVSDRTGINALGKMLVGFGTVSGDFSLSGREDLVVANGHVMRYPVNNNRKQEPLYIENRVDKKLVRIMFEPDSFFGKKYCSRSVIAPDLNTDGKLDLVFANVNEPAVLLENTTETKGNWVVLKLIGTSSNRDAIGALVELETDKRKLVRQVFGGGSYLSQGPYELHFGVPTGEAIKRLKITWPNGGRTETPVDEVNRIYSIVEQENDGQA